MTLHLYNTLTGKKEEFMPIDTQNVRMYVCGPTVYDRPHIGNARAVVVYDVLYRILKEIYGEKNVTYVRNITDVDDKINKAAKENNETIQNLTARITKLFHDDMATLNNLPPTHEPKATENIENIKNLIQKIIDNGNAYVSEGHVLLDVSSIPDERHCERASERSNPEKHFAEIASLAQVKPSVMPSLSRNDTSYHYGILSGKIIWKNIAGARIEVESYKRNPEDFVLWKPADKDDDISSVFDSPWGKGRPGWHIECSAMSSSILGNDFDIHGGGADLKFPHHENEIAQSKCAHPESHYARYWVHNGFVTVNGEKMSKSLGNFTTVKDLLDRGWHGETIRLALLSTHYRKPLDFNDKVLEDAEKTLDKFYGAIENAKKQLAKDSTYVRKNAGFDKVYEVFLGAEGSGSEGLLKDMNCSNALTALHGMATITYKDFDKYYSKSGIENWLFNFQKMCNLLGICQLMTEEWFARKQKNKTNEVSEEYIIQKIAERAEAKKNKNFALADKIRDELAGQGVTLKDNKDGTTEWNNLI